MNGNYMMNYYAPQVYQNNIDDEYDTELDGYNDEIINSSPSPPERTNMNHFTYSSASQYLPRYDDPIEDYVDVTYPQASDQPYYEDEHWDGQQTDVYDEEFFEERGNFAPIMGAYPPRNEALPMTLEYDQRPRYQNWSSNHRPPQQPRLPASNLYSLNAGRPSKNEPDREAPSCRSAKGIRLRPVTELPDVYRTIFKFGVFNAVQSSCFDTLMQSNENLVTSAPTGSGKTVLFELAIIQMLTETNSATDNSVKCVYMAPTKVDTFSSMFHPYSISRRHCVRRDIVTGPPSSAHWGLNAEKWDSLTRNWGDHGKILSSIRLILVDEVHILNESRGSTLEVVISRMKKRGSGVRFVLVSATVPNIQDIASWIGNARCDGSPAKIFEFGEDFRPCKLKRVVVGVPRQRNQNDFQFSKILDYKLFSTLQTHSVGKPILVFCPTRKGVFATAEHVLKDYIEAEKKKQSLPWTYSERVEHIFQDKRLAEWASYGIGVHHAGLSLDDRRAVEGLFLKKVLRIVIATSTLAVGVNLPAHTVVIKGVQTFQNNVSVEYSDLDVMQMLGRAGRPQFDSEGTAIILCETELESKYRQLVQGKTILESSLHVNLSEHLNSEIGLGTVTSISSATDWLRNSFLFQRIRKNPRHYALGKDEGQTWEERVDDLVMQSISKLKESELITCSEDGGDGQLSSTEYGDIMSKFYIRQATMKAILTLPGQPSIRDILEMISASEELNESKIRASEKTYLNKLRRHIDIRFEVKKVEKTSDKAFLLIQAVLGGISLNSPEYKTGDSQPQLDAFSVFRHIPRIARAVVEVAITKKRGAQLKHGFEVLRCLTAKAWEDRPVVLRQIESIGEKSLKVLAEQGIISIDILRKQDSLRLEALLNRRPPFGLEILASAREFPSYALKITELEVRTSGGTKLVEVDLSIECGLIDETFTSQQKSKKQKGRVYNMTSIITLTSDMELIDFRRISTKSLKENKAFEVTAELEKPSQSINVYISSECVAGVTVTKSYKPDISASQYPTRNTRPQTSLELEIQDYKEDPKFWDMMDGVDSFDDKAEVKDLTKKEATKNKPSSSILEVLNDTKMPKKLPNGNYLSLLFAGPFSMKANKKHRCNHSCKDRNKCRHLCCKEGTLHPPKKPVPAATTTTTPPISTTKSQIPKSSQTTSQTQWQRVVDIKKKTPTNPDRTLERLEALHKNTNVQDNLKLTEGQRIKLEPVPDVKKRKRKAAPDPEIKFADIGDSQPLQDVCHDISYNLDDDDDLPEAHEIMTSAPRKNAHSSDGFADSDIDALIRDFPDDNDFGARPASPLNTRFSSSPVPKRMRLSDESSKVQQEPLFVHASDSDDEVIVIDDDESVDAGNKQNDYDHYEDFTLDPGCFDIISSTPDLTMSSDNSFSSQQNSSVVMQEHDTGSAVEENVEQIDDFAELEAWLNSGAVEIIS
ncbi:Sec63 Brl domain-containing protein [Armillaria novae-zelandiae]|uniref:DNA 3'-5' helicase n=1 Tax=Armillaria novae-zelandiae TaxID=153914 RepID=A0AA39UCC7_9AGAR|nr:Sec63 Brl domain-containing protein [Armillaria novae-zelandiae]